MVKPSAKFQVNFLDYIQRLLDGGGFVASYKYALLMALADLSVEKGDDSRSSLCLNSEDVAHKFIQYYSRQVIPFKEPSDVSSGILHQNTDKQAAIITLVHDASPTYTTLGNQKYAKLLQQDKKLVGNVTTLVTKMPLWRLQRIAGKMDDALYENIGKGHDFELRPGIAFCFRKFHSFITRLSQEGWIRFIRQRTQNEDLLGQRSDLSHFLFGVNRASLAPYKELLEDLQSGKCFYCSKEKKDTHVDHYIPWSWYNLDLGHNFVLACSSCNGQKGDMLAAPKHLDSWLERNATQGVLMQEYFDLKSLPNDKESSLFIAQWAYGRVAGSSGHTWVQRKTFQAIDEAWSFPSQISRGEVPYGTQ